MDTAHAASPGDGTLFGSLPPTTQDQLREHTTSMSVPAEDWLLRQGDEGDAMYLVQSGRLEVLLEHPGPMRRLNVLRAGSTLGEMALLTGQPRVASVRALRDSEVLRLTRERFSDLVQADAAFALALARELAKLVERGNAGKVATPPHTGVLAVVGLQDGLPGQRFVEELCRAIEDWGTVAVLDGSDPQPDGGRGGEDLVAAGHRLDRYERDHDHVLLVAPTTEPAWRQFCLRQADRVLVVARPADRLSADTNALRGCDLAIIHRAGTTAVAPLLDGLAPGTRHLVGEGPGYAEDVARLARRLTGRSLGLVLSGGGARGFAHIGVLEALADAGVVIDRIGGCSMGAFVGALTAMGMTPAEVKTVCREELSRRRPFNDYTVPRFSLIRARKAEAMLRRLFGEHRIEQLDIDYFCVSADLLRAEVVVHRQGALPEAVGASMSIPGLVPPLVQGGQLLVDGGVLNNLPIDVMASAGEGPVIAVDVMGRMLDPSEAKAAARAGQHRWRPTIPGRGDTARPSRDPLPTIVETLSRVTVLGSWRTAAENRSLAAVVISPEVANIGLFEFDRLDAAVEAGRRAAALALDSWPLSGAADL